MQDLNEKQLEAVTTTEGYIRVISGAGTGKTRIITNRYIYLVNELGIANKNILCVTFTNNAANEMKKRIDKIVKDKDVGYICTFHSLAVKCLREDIHCVGIVPNFIILDKEDQSEMLKRIYKKLEISSREYHYDDMLEFISKTKSKQKVITTNNNPIDYINYLGGLNNEKVMKEDCIENKFFNEYLEEQKRNSILDFNDLINIFLYILMCFKEKREKWQKRFQYIMCDEFNDIDRKQYLILKILSQYHKNLLIVGDPDQSIYGWRGSDIGYILNFPKDFENTRDIIVNTNYRSIPSILDVANSLIKNNKNRLDKDLIPNRTGNDKVVFSSLTNSQKEAEWVVEQIEKLKEKGEDLSNIAVLYRNNNFSRNVEEQLLKKNIKYCIYSGIDFYSRKEIKDIISYLRFILYEQDVDFQRIINTPKRNFGSKKLEILFKYADERKCSLYQALKENVDTKEFKKIGISFIKLIDHLKSESEILTVSELVNEILDITGYEKELIQHNEQERIENIEELKHGIIEFEKVDIEEKSLKDYIDKISLYTNNDKKTSKNAVKLMTIHASKGLEFKYVFVVRINDGVLPSSKSQMPEEIEEERRLFYVAITRAKDKLYLTDTQTNYDDEENNCSRFLKELDKDNIQFENKQSMDRIIQESIRNTENNLEIPKIDFKVGDKVIHTVFGRGIIESINISDKTYSIKFDKFDTLRDISIHIKLEKTK